MSKTLYAGFERGVVMRVIDVVAAMGRRCLCGFRAVAGLTVAAVLLALPAGAQDVQPAIEKANLYIEVAKNTERAVESWERYASWVNMKTGPTGKERYLSYGMYELYDMEPLLKEARDAAGREPRAEAVDAAMVKYIAAYEALAPVMSEAAAYYERQGYEADKMKLGKALHPKMVPLATAFLAERKAMMPLLRAHLRDVEAMEVAALEAKDGRTAAFHTAAVMAALHRVMDTFPRERPERMNADEMDQMMAEIGPDTPGEKFEQLMAGVKPSNATIDVARFGAALDAYGKAVDGFEGFSGETPKDFAKFKPMPGEMRIVLQEFQKPLVKSGGREFDGAGQMVMRLTQRYYDMMNESQSVWGSQLRHLP
jgi:hypothetical protein